MMIAASTDHGATAAGSGDSPAMSLDSPTPITTPIAAPMALSVAASTTNCDRMSRRRALRKLLLQPAPTFGRISQPRQGRVGRGDNEPIQRDAEDRTLFGRDSD